MTTSRSHSSRSGRASRLPHAFVLVGGLGLRLRSVVADRPKVLADVDGRPFLAFVLHQILSQGGTVVTLCAGHQAGEIEAFAARFSSGSAAIDVSVEQHPLGTAGAVRKALDGCEVGMNEALVMNGDSLFDVPLGDLVAAHRAAGADVTVAVRHVDDVGRYGAVTVAEGRVVAFDEKGRTGPGLVNAGIYVIRPAILDRAPLDAFVSLERDVLPGLARDAAAVVVARAYDGYFIDIGVPADYARAREGLAAMTAARAGAA